jgi:hypothetical protein
MTIGFFGEPQEAHGRGDGHAEQHVRALDVAVRERVPDPRPARTLAHHGVDAVLLEEAFLVGDHDRGAVREGDHAELQVGDFRGVAGPNAAGRQERGAQGGHARFEKAAARATGDGQGNGIIHGQ